MINEYLVKVRESLYNVIERIDDAFAYMLGKDLRPAYASTDPNYWEPREIEKSELVSILNVFMGDKSKRNKTKLARQQGKTQDRRSQDKKETHLRVRSTKTYSSSDLPKWMRK